MMHVRAVPGFHDRIILLPDGAYDVYYCHRRYLLRKNTCLDGKLIKLFAQELGGNNFISLNYYPKTAEGLLKPCEMSDEKVITFVCELEIASDGDTKGHNQIKKYKIPTI